MRRSIASLAALGLVAGCGGPQPEREGRTFDVQEEPRAGGSANMSTMETMDSAAPATRSAGPNVSPTAAPGVAFNYQYAFRLASDRIAGVQEEHAAACENLGPNRCRITGMRYRLVGERDVEARLEFKLEPGLARRFGRAGLEVVQRADGTLVESQISGTDVATGIRTSSRGIAELSEDLRRIEQQLAQARSPGDRENLRFQAEELRRQIRGLQQSREEAQESLATTPMVFEYGSGNYGSDRPDFRRAADSAWEGFLWGLYGLMVLLTTILPWVALVLLIALAVRWVRRRLPRRPVVNEQPEAML